MKKMSSGELHAVLGVVPETLRKLASERDFWKGEAESRIRRDEVTKVAQAMHDKGINSEVPMEDLIAQLDKAAGLGQLDKIASAIDLVGPNMAEKIASLSDSNSGNAASTTFEQFIMGAVG